MTTANRIMGGVGKAGFFMGLGVAAGVGVAVKEAADFQEKINVLGAISGATTGQLEQLRKKALALGEDTTLASTSASDAADTLTALARGGLNVKQSMEAAKGSIQLATAAEIDNKDAALIQARALKSFHLAAGDAAHVADLLANAANKSTADITDLALGVQQASAVWHAGGQTLDGLTTAITEMADAGVTGSDAGTSLKTMMQRLNPQTKKAKEEMKQLGVQVFDAKGNYRDIRDIIGQFHGALDKLTPKQRQHALYTIFGSDAIRAANIVLDGGTKKYDKYNKAVEKGGTAAKISRAHQKGFNGAMDNFLSTLQTTAIELGTDLLPIFTKWLRELAKAAHWLGVHKTATEILVGTLGALAAIMVTVTAAYKVYQTYSRLAAFYTTVFKDSTLLLRIQLGLLSAQQKIVTAYQWAMNVAMEANPIFLVVAAIVALVAIMVILYLKWKPFHEIVDSSWDLLKKFAGWIKDVFAKFVPKAFNAVINWLKAHWKDAIILLVGGPFLFLIKKADDAFGLRQKLASGLQTVLGKIKDWGGRVLDFFRALPGKIADFGSRIGGRLKDAVVNGVKGMSTVLAGAVKGALNGVISIWNGLKIPGFSWGVHKGPIDFSVSIPSIDLPDIPRLAQGGIVYGPTLAMLGDNPGRKEAVVPLPERGDMLGGGGGITVNLNVEGSVLADRDLEAKLLDVLTTYGRRNGRVRLATASSI